MKYLLAFLFVPFTLSAQINKQFVVSGDIFYDKVEYSGSDLFGFIDNGKLGYMDINHKVIIPTSAGLEKEAYGSLPYFSNGFAVFKKDNKYGLVNKAGKTVIPFEYSSLYFFPVLNNTLLANKSVVLYGNYGVINTNNKVIIPFEYDDITAPLPGKYFVVKKNNKFGLKDINGKDVLPTEYTQLTINADNNVILAKKGDDYGFMDMKGNWLFKKTSAVYTLLDCKYGMILCKVNDKYGFLNLKGEEVIPTQFDWADYFNEFGIARVGNRKKGSTYSNLYGYINKQGGTVIPIQYETLYQFTNGYAMAKDLATNRYGFLNSKGEWALKPTYISASNFDKYGGAWVKMTDDKYHYIDKKGKDFGTFDKTGEYHEYFNEVYTVAEDNNPAFTLINNKGKAIKTIDDCKKIYSISDDIAGYQSAENDLYGFVDMKGNKIGKAEFSGFMGFHEGLSRVFKTVDGKSKCGFVDRNGIIVIPIIYDMAYSFENGWSLVEKDSQNLFINKQGKEFPMPRKYDKIITFRSGFAMGSIKIDSTLNTYYYINKDLKEAFSIEAKEGYNFQENVAVINRTGYYELMDITGKPYKELTDVETVKFSKEGLLAIRKNNKWGFIDKKGNEVIPCTYDDCETFVGNYAKVKMNGKWGIIDKTGKTIIEPQYENIIPSEDGTFIYLDRYWGIIDKTGEKITEPIYFSITPFSNGIAIGKTKKSFAIIKSPLAK